MGRFTGQHINPNALGGKGFFSLESAVAVTPPACPQHLIQAGSSPSFPGTTGTGQPVVGWFGVNDGNPGAGFCGATISGEGLFLPGGTYGYCDQPDAIRIPDANPSFMVFSGQPLAQGAFTQVTINGQVFVAAAVSYFDNGGGCGPTYWIFQNRVAGLVDGTQYCVVWVVGT